MEFHSHQRLRTRGFTLIELMVVLILMGILTLLILPQMTGSFEDALLRSTGRKLVMALGLTHSRAVTVGQEHRLRLDPEEGRYQVLMESRESGGLRFVPVQNVSGAEGTLDPRVSLEMEFPQANLEPEQAREAAFDAFDDPEQPDDQSIAFYPDGTAEGGGIVLRDRQGFGLALRVNPITAHVRAVELEREVSQ